MTSRQGLSLALVGLLMAAICCGILFLLRNLDDPGGGVNTLGDLGLVSMGVVFVLFLDLGALVGIIMMVTGLVFALKKQA